MISWKQPASWALVIASALIMAAPAQCEVSSPPSIEGTYVLIQSIPEVNMEAREFTKDLFFPHQKIHFADLGVMEEEGYDVFQGQDQLILTIYPPFPMAMCRQERWKYDCQNNGTYIPFEPIKQEMGANVDTPLDDEMEDLAPVLKSRNSKTKQKDIIRYGMTFFDKSGGYLMFAIDKDTLVNQTFQYDPNVPDNADASERMITTLQIFKRIPDDPKPPQNKSPVPSKDE
ncbi:hypothetical protein [Ottowia massiliensis]|uniref:hypothetical protein n=1 Tax=Ottowia massiliensis TaxID=2045302 RepID=UPI000C826DBD|nr:hypothetical protein [Ottowia massiliensis]